MHAVLRNPALRALAGAPATFNLFDSMLLAVYVLYMSRTLHLSAATIGLVFGLAGVGGLLSALIVAPLTARLGVGRAIQHGFVLASAGELLIAAAGGPQVVAVAVLLAAEGLVELGIPLYGINAASLKQAITPDHMRGRVAATNELLIHGVGPVGAVLGGILGQTIGLRPTIVVAGMGTFLSLLWLVQSPLRELREMPA
jgi:MFS family permease